MYVLINFGYFVVVVLFIFGIKGMIIFKIVVCGN